jgi:hypothetical protein
MAVAQTEDLYLSSSPHLLSSIAVDDSDSLVYLDGEAESGEQGSLSGSGRTSSPRRQFHTTLHQHSADSVRGANPANLEESEKQIKMMGMFLKKIETALQELPVEPGQEGDSSNPKTLEAVLRSMMEALSLLLIDITLGHDHRTENRSEMAQINTDQSTRQRLEMEKSIKAAEAAAAQQKILKWCMLAVTLVLFVVTSVISFGTMSLAAAIVVTIVSAAILVLTQTGALDKFVDFCLGHTEEDISKMSPEDQKAFKIKRLAIEATIVAVFSLVTGLGAGLASAGTSAAAFAAEGLSMSTRAIVNSVVSGVTMGIDTASQLALSSSIIADAAYIYVYSHPREDETPEEREKRIQNVIMWVTIILAIVAVASGFAACYSSAKSGSCAAGAIEGVGSEAAKDLPRVLALFAKGSNALEKFSRSHLVALIVTGLTISLANAGLGFGNAKIELDQSDILERRGQTESIFQLMIDLMSLNNQAQSSDSKTTKSILDSLAAVIENWDAYAQTLAYAARLT